MKPILINKRNIQRYFLNALKQVLKKRNILMMELLK